MKAHIKLIEKIALYVGAGLLIALGLVWNLYADIVLKSGSGPLFIGLITSIVGGVLIFVASVINSFDVKIKGLIIECVGILLGIGNIVYFIVGVKPLGRFGIITLIGVSIGALVSLGGFTIQIVRKVLKIED